MQILRPRASLPLMLELCALQHATHFNDGLAETWADRSSLILRSPSPHSAEGRGNPP